MTAAYDHPSSDELEPDLDEAERDELLDREVDDGRALEAIDHEDLDDVDEPAPAPEREPAPALALCVRCHERRVWDPAGFYPGDPYAGHCAGCRDQLTRDARLQAETEREAARAAELKAANERMHARFAASPYSCPDCGEKVLDRPGRCGACLVLERERQDRRDIVDATARALPVRYRWCSFSAPELAQRVLDTKAIAQVRKAVADGADRILLLGPTPGVGKTVLGACALVELAALRGFEGRFIEAQDYAYARARAPLGAEVPDVQAAIECDALVIDELGPDKPVHNSPVAETIHARHAAMRVTIVTSGVSLAQLAERFGDGILRRLTEGAAVIHVTKGAPR